MFAFPKKSLSFIIRVWIEPQEIKADKIVWRGTVEAVGSSASSGGPPDHKAFLRLDELLEFLARQMEDLGIPKEQLYDQKP